MEYLLWSMKQAPGMESRELNTSTRKYSRRCESTGGDRRTVTDTVRCAERCLWLGEQSVWHPLGLHPLGPIRRCPQGPDRLRKKSQTATEVATRAKQLTENTFRKGTASAVPQFVVY